MNLDEIKRNAPEGATHYEECGDGDVCYYLNDEGHWLAADDNGDWWNLFSGDFRYYEKTASPFVEGFFYNNYLL